MNRRSAAAVRRLARRALWLFAALGIAIAAAPPAAALDTNSPVQAAFIQLFLIILIFALIIGILVHVLLLLAVRWYKDSPRWRPSKHAPREHDRRLELGWTIGPVAILASVAIVTLAAIPGIERPPALPPGQSYPTITVVAQQWAWRFEYPDYVYPSNNTSVAIPSSSGTLYIQQGVTFMLDVVSEDVIHSFYVPDLAIAIDANPGVTNQAWVRADVAGTYSIQCKEFCGLGHSQMHGLVVVFAPGSQPFPWGPAARPTPGGGGGTPTGAVIDIEFKQSGGPSADRPWSISPSRINLGQGFNVTFRIWNNESGTHQFRIGDPYNLLGVVMAPNSPTPDVINFRTNYTGAIDYWCDIPGHRALGMEGVMNVSGPQDVTVVMTDNSVQPSTLTFGLGWTVNLTMRNEGSVPHGCAIGPPYDTVLTPSIPAGGTFTYEFVFNLTTAATWIGGALASERAAGIEGLLVVQAAGAAPAPTAPQAFPVVPFTFALVGIGGAAAVGFDLKLARDARRREKYPPEEE